MTRAPASVEPHLVADDQRRESAPSVGKAAVLSARGRGRLWKLGLRDGRAASAVPIAATPRLSPSLNSRCWNPSMKPRGSPCAVARVRTGGELVTRDQHVRSPFSFLAIRMRYAVDLRVTGGADRRLVERLALEATRSVWITVATFVSRSIRSNSLRAAVTASSVEQAGLVRHVRDPFPRGFAGPLLTRTRMLGFHVAGADNQRQNSQNQNHGRTGRSKWLAPSSPGYRLHLRASGTAAAVSAACSRFMLLEHPVDHSRGRCRRGPSYSGRRRDTR